MAGGQGDSRTIIQDFCASVLGIHISLSLGAIQKVIDRVSSAIEPHYDEIGKVARQSEVNHVDETSFSKKEALQWLWVMANSTVAFFMIHANRSRKAFEALIRDWDGILVSDGYGVYCKWVGLRQSCLAHLIRKARELSQKKDPEIAPLRQLGTGRASAPLPHGSWSADHRRVASLLCPPYPTHYSS